MNIATAIKPGVEPVRSIILPLSPALAHKGAAEKNKDRASIKDVFIKVPLFLEIDELWIITEL